MNYKKKLDETADEILLFSITELRERFQTNASEIIVPFDVSIKLPGVNYTVPKRGDKKQLLELTKKAFSFEKSLMVDIRQFLIIILAMN